MSKRSILTMALASTLFLLTVSDAFAGWRYHSRRCCPTYYGPTVQYRAAPATVAPAPPTAPVDGQTTRSPSVEPAPPSAPAQGRTIQRYSVEPTPAPASQPAPTYQQAPTYRQAPSQSGGFSRSPVERRLRPGRGFFD